MATKNIKKIIILTSVIFSIMLITCSEPKQEAKDTESVNRDSLTIELNGSDSLTVFEILKLNHKVTTKSSAIGKFVTGIDSIFAGDGYFWVYTVNDTVPQIACDKMKVGKTDNIKWYFRK